MMRLAFLIALLATSCTPSVPEVSLANIDPLIAQQISNAMAEVRKAPRSSPAWGGLGMVLKSAGLESNAQECFVRAEKLDPDNPRWPYFQGSVESLRRAVAVANPEQSFIRLRLAHLLAEAGRWSEAEEHFRATGHSLGLGQAACAQNKWEEAVPHLERARQNEFNAKTATTLLATVKLRLGDIEAARLLSQQATALRPDVPTPNPFESELSRYATGKRAWIEEAQILLAQGKNPHALAVIDRLVSSYPAAAEGWLYLGRVQLLQNNLGAAEQSLARHLQLDPASLDGHLQMGLVLHRQARLPQAAAEFQKAILAKPDSEMAHYFLGVVQHGQGDTETAVRSFNEALRHQPAFAPARKALDEISRPR